MKFIQGKDRNQITFFCLEEQIEHNNEIRFIELFVNSINLADAGFKLDFIENGRPAYHPADLLKLFLYGYLNRIRSSRQLEKECKRNIELMWLMRGLVPDHNTIANFRKDNPQAIKNVFRSTVKLAQHFQLIGGKLIAGDGTKLRAQNSKKNNFNEKKIERHIAYIDNKLDEYNSILASEDKDLSEEKKQEINSKINKHQLHKKQYQDFQKQLEATGEVQISTSDPESRQMIVRNNITEVAYNIQSTVDAKLNIPINYEVTNENDSKAMGSMLQQAVEVLGNNEFTAVFDKGYHTGSEFKKADGLGVDVVVAIPDISSSSMAPDPSYNVANFVFNEEENVYICPQGNALSTNGKWYKKDRNYEGRKKQPPILVQHYKTTACKTCPLINSCTKNTRGRGRVIERTEFAPYIEKNKLRMQQAGELYRKRQAIVEHPFGIIKRQWDFYYIMTKQGISRASADVGLIFTAFNLRRIFNLLDPNLLKKFLKELGFIFSIQRSQFKAFYDTFFFKKWGSSSEINLILSS